MREKEGKKCARSQTRTPPDLRLPLSQTGWPKTLPLKKTVEALPKTPKKKAELLETIIFIQSADKKNYRKERHYENSQGNKGNRGTLGTHSRYLEGTDHIKKRGSNDSRAAYSAFKKLAFGQNVA